MGLPIGKVLKTLGTVGKGFATVVGSVLGIGGVGAAVAGGNEQLAACITTLLSQPEGITMALGGVLVAFGIGRKAMAAAAKK